MNIEWTEWAVHQVEAMARTDHDYQELRTLCAQQERQYPHVPDIV